jgi:hypothetical protein
MLRPAPRDIRGSRVLWALGQALFVVLCIYLYFRIRNITEGSYEVAVAHAQDLVELEERLGIAVEETMQAPFVGSGVLGTAANSVYIYGHWPVIVAVMVWTVWRHRGAFLLQPTQFTNQYAAMPSLHAG